MDTLDTENAPLASLDLDDTIRNAFPASDDAPTAFDRDGAPLGFGPMREASMVPHTTVRVEVIRHHRWTGAPTHKVHADHDYDRMGMEPGAIEGAGGTWWVPAGAAWSVDPNAIPALSKAGRQWLKRSRRNLSAVESPGETGQKLTDLKRAYRETHTERSTRATRAAYRDASALWLGVDPTTGETVLTLSCPEANARAIVEGYGKAGRVLEMRPA